MKYSRNVPTAVVLCFLCFILIAIPAYGYIDPNAAGLSQILTPLLVAAAAVFAFFRKQMRAAFAGMSRRLRRGANA